MSDRQAIVADGGNLVWVLNAGLRQSVCGYEQRAGRVGDLVRWTWRFVGTGHAVRYRLRLLVARKREREQRISEAQTHAPNTV